MVLDNIKKLLLQVAVIGIVMYSFKMIFKIISHLSFIYIASKTERN